MNAHQKMVDEFHEKFLLQRPTEMTPTGERYKFNMGDLNRELRIKLIKEETKELEDALTADDHIEVIDALCDLLYVTYGAAVSMGVDLTPYFAEVHRSNMSKLGADGKPVMREDGKALKGPNYTPPNLLKVFLDEQAKRDSAKHYVEG